MYGHVITKFSEMGRFSKLWGLPTRTLRARSELRYKYCVNRLRDMSYDHFCKNRKFDKTGGVFKKRSQAVIYRFSQG